jgi:hypothetical protein
MLYVLKYSNVGILGPSRSCVERRETLVDHKDPGTSPLSSEALARILKVCPMMVYSSCHLPKVIFEAFFRIWAGRRLSVNVVCDLRGL